MTTKRINPLLTGMCPTEKCGSTITGRMSIMQVTLGVGTTLPITCAKCGVASVYTAQPNTLRPVYLEAIDDVDAANERECP